MVVYIEPVADKTLQIPMRDITVSNVPEGFEAEISESAEDLLTLELQGLGAQIEPLRYDNVFGVVNLATWMEKEGMERIKAGSYIIPVTFLLDEQITVSNTPSVRVTIKEIEE